MISIPLALFLPLALPQSPTPAEARTLNALRGLDREDLEARVHWSRDARAQGLKAEALRELDRVLQRDPDHAGALAELCRGSWIDLDKPREQLWREAGSRPGQGGAVRELCLAGLRSGTSATAWRQELELSLQSPIVERRELALVALRRAFAGELPRQVLASAVYDPSLRVQTEAARTIRAAQDPNWILPLVRTLERSPSSSARSAAARALGIVGHRAAVEPLVARLAAPQASTGASSRVPHSHIFVGTQRAYVQDFDVEVAAFSSAAKPVVNTLIEGAVLDVAVTSVASSAVLLEQATIRTSLAQLTGERGMHTNAAWLAWWKKHGASWLSAAPEAGAQTAPRTLR